MIVVVFVIVVVVVVRWYITANLVILGNGIILMAFLSRRAVGPAVGESKRLAQQLGVPGIRFPSDATVVHSEEPIEDSLLSDMVGTQPKPCAFSELKRSLQPSLVLGEGGVGAQGDEVVAMHHNSDPPFGVGKNRWELSCLG